MKEQLARYVDLLFAGAPEATDIKEEILQNTLDRYDDLIEQGKTPQAAYQLAISGIGDINEILGCEPQGVTPPQSAPKAPDTPKHEKPIWKKLLQAVAIFFYIICPIPLFIEQDETGLCVLLALVAIATALMVISGGKNHTAPKEETKTTPHSELRRATKSVIWAVGLCVYFALSFSTGAWYITWVLFPLFAAVQGLVFACMDLKEADKYEN